MLIGNYYGTQAFAAYNIGVNMLNICMVAGFGFSIAGSTLVGQALGADDAPGAVRAGWRSLRMAIATMGGLGIIVIYFARDLATFFIGNDPVTIQYTVEFTYVLGAMMPLMAIDFAIGGSLRGAGRYAFSNGHDVLWTDRHALYARGDIHVRGVAGALGVCRADRRLRAERHHAVVAIPIGSLAVHRAQRRFDQRQCLSFPT